MSVLWRALQGHRHSRRPGRLRQAGPDDAQHGHHCVVRVVVVHLGDVRQAPGLDAFGHALEAVPPAGRRARCDPRNPAARCTVSPSAKPRVCSSYLPLRRSRASGVPDKALKILLQARHLKRCSPSAILLRSSRALLQCGHALVWRPLDFSTSMQACVLDDVLNLLRAPAAAAWLAVRPVPCCQATRRAPKRS